MKRLYSASIIRAVTLMMEAASTSVNTDNAYESTRRLVRHRNTLGSIQHIQISQKSVNHISLSSWNGSRVIKRLRTHCRRQRLQRFVRDTRNTEKSGEWRRLNWWPGSLHERRYSRRHATESTARMTTMQFQAVHPPNIYTTHEEHDIAFLWFVAKLCIHDVTAKCVQTD